MLRGVKKVILLSDKSKSDIEPYTHDVIMLRANHQTQVPKTLGSKSMKGCQIKWVDGNASASQRASQPPGSSSLSHLVAASKTKVVNEWIVSSVKALSLEVGFHENPFEDMDEVNKVLVLPLFVRALGRLICSVDAKQRARAALIDRVVGDTLVSLWDLFLQALSRFIVDFEPSPSTPVCMVFYNKFARLLRRMVDPAFVIGDTRQMAMNMIEALGCEVDPNTLCEPFIHASLSLFVLTFIL